MTPERSGVWVYAVVSGQVTEVPEDAAGGNGALVRLVRGSGLGSGLAAVVGSLPPDLAGEEELRDRLRDPAWLERTVRAHHQVVSGFFRRTPTVPFRMATVCRGDARVRELLAEQAGGLRAALSAVAGRAEWGVQAYPGQVPNGPPAGPPPGPPPGPPAGQVPVPAAGDPGRPGTAYLLRRRAERQRQEQARAAAAAAARELDAGLAELAVAVHRPTPAAGAGSPAPLFHASYLVDQERGGEFAARVRQLAGWLPQVRVRLTGPWPAYSFVTLAGEGSLDAEASLDGEAS